MVKELAHALLADDERLVADAMPHVPARWRERVLVQVRAAEAEAEAGVGVA